MSPKPTVTPLDFLWQAPTLFRILLAGEGLAVILTLAPGQMGNLWIYFGLTSIVIQWVFLSTLGTLYLARRPLARCTPESIANIALLILVIASILVCTACWLVIKKLWSPDHAQWHWVFLRFIGIILIFGMIGLTAFQNHWRTQQMALRAKQAELDALQARIHPHFLFNTLNTGAALVHQQPEKAEQLLLDLADLFRAALAGPSQISLQEELELARRYAQIEQLRFGSRLRLQWDLPEPLPELQVPTLSIQPLLENAIHHGVEPSATGCLLRVAVEIAAHQARVIVANDLPDSPDATPRSGHGVGLRAVRERVRAMGGEVETRSENGQFWVTVTLPLAT